MDVATVFIVMQMHKAFQPVALPYDVSPLAPEPQRIVDRIKGLHGSQIDLVSLKEIQEVGLDALPSDYFRFCLPSIMSAALSGVHVMIVWSVTILTPGNVSSPTFDAYVDQLSYDQRAVVHEFLNWVDEFHKDLFVDADGELLPGLWYWKELTADYVTDSDYIESLRLTLNELIEGMFPQTIPFGPERIVHPHAVYYDKPYVREMFEGKSWKQLTDTDMYVVSTHLNNLSVETFCYYIPAFLVALSDPNQYASHSNILSELCPKPDDLPTLDARVSCLSEEQKHLISVVLRFIELHGNAGSLAEEQLIQKAIATWAMVS